MIKVIFSDIKTSSDIFVCNPFQSCYNMARHIPEIQSKCINLIVDKFLFKSIDALAKLENIFTPKVRSSFESEEEMLNFVKQLFIRFAEITTVNGFAVRFLIFIFYYLTNRKKKNCLCIL